MLRESGQTEVVEFPFAALPAEPAEIDLHRRASSGDGEVEEARIEIGSAQQFAAALAELRGGTEALHPHANCIG